MVVGTAAVVAVVVVVTATGVVVAKAIVVAAAVAAAVVALAGLVLAAVVPEADAASKLKANTAKVVNATGLVAAGRARLARWPDMLADATIQAARQCAWDLAGACGRACDRSRGSTRRSFCAVCAGPDWPWPFPKDTVRSFETSSRKRSSSYARCLFFCRAMGWGGRGVWRGSGGG